MEAFFEAFTAMTQTRSFWIYLIIFLGKMLEVTTSTLRIVLINRGIRLVGSLISIVEIILWLIITSTVLSGFQSDPFKIVVYAMAYGCGCYLGSWLDEKLAFGLSSIQIVLSSMEDAKNLTRAMREKGYGITTMEVHGGIDDQPRYMMLVMIRRRRLNEALKLINQTVSSAVITVSDVKVQKGGYLRNNPAGSIQSIMHKKPRWPWEERKASAAAKSGTEAAHDAPAPHAPAAEPAPDASPCALPAEPAPAKPPQQE